MNLSLSEFVKIVLISNTKYIQIIKVTEICEDVFKHIDNTIKESLEEKLGFLYQLLSSTDKSYLGKL